MSLNLTQLHAKTVETSCLLSLWQNLKAPHSGVEYMANNNIKSHLIPLVGLSYALAVKEQYAISQRHMYHKDMVIVYIFYHQSIHLRPGNHGNI